MPPTLYLVRHAEGFHNVNRRHHLRDPLITPLGRSQCQQLREKFPHHDDIDIVMASPLKRTIQTASFCFDRALAKPDVPFLLVPLAQEIAANPCDVGHDRDEIQAALPEVINETVPFDTGKIDFGLVEEGWNSKQGIYYPSFSAVEKRAAALRSWLFQRPEQHICLVSHGAFMHYLIEDFSFFDTKKGSNNPLKALVRKALPFDLLDHVNRRWAGTAWENCEVRYFEFSDNSTADDAHLVERGQRDHVKQGRPEWMHRHVLDEIEAVAETSKTQPAAQSTL